MKPIVERAVSDQQAPNKENTMKLIYIAILAGLLAGCATAPSEYNQGCRDGVNGIGLEKGSKENVDRYCDKLDSERRAAERLREGKH